MCLDDLFSPSLINNITAFLVHRVPNFYFHIIRLSFISCHITCRSRLVYGTCQLQVRIKFELQNVDGYIVGNLWSFMVQIHWWFKIIAICHNLISNNCHCKIFIFWPCLIERWILLNCEKLESWQHYNVSAHTAANCIVNYWCIMLHLKL